MKNKRRFHWRDQKEQSSRVMLWLLAWIALHIGRRSTFLLLYPIVFCFFLTAHNARRVSREYLKRALRRTPTWQEVWQHFYTFAAVSVDRFYFLSGRENLFQCSWSGEEIFKEYAAKKQGVILVVSHFGSFDAMRAPGIRQYHLPIRMLMDKQHHSRAMALLETLDPGLAASVLDTHLSPPELILTLSECLKRGEWIGMMADRAGRNERVEACSFLGGRAHFPVGPWLLSHILKLPVILCFAFYEGDRRYRLAFELAIEQTVATRKERNMAIQKAIEHYAKRLEHYIHLFPYNWFNFFDFWIDETPSHH